MNDGKNREFMQAARLTVDMAKMSIRRVLEDKRIKTLSSTGFVEVRMNMVDQYWKTFRAGHRQFYGDYCPEEGQVNEAFKELSEVEDLYVEASGRLTDRMEEISPRPGNRGQGGQTVHQPPIELKLPVDQSNIRNTWGMFDGVITKWQGFRDRFVAAVHDKEEISPAYKFNYLKSSLTGYAATAFGEWQVNDQNYMAAWDRLNELFDDNYRLCRDHTRRLLHLTSMNKSTKQLFRMVQG